MTMRELLASAQSIVAMGQAFPVGDPRLTLALALLHTTLGVVENVVKAESTFGDQPIAVEHLGDALAANLVEQLEELRRTA